MTAYFISKDFIIADKITHFTVDIPKTFEDIKRTFGKKIFIADSKLHIIKNNPHCKLLFISGRMNDGFCNELMEQLSDSETTVDDLYNSLRLTFDLTKLEKSTTLFLLSPGADGNGDVLTSINLGPSRLSHHEYTLDGNTLLVFGSASDDVNWILKRPELHKGLTPLDLMVFVQSISNDFGDVHSSYNVTTGELTPTVRLTDTARKKHHTKVISRLAKISDKPLLTSKD